MTKQEFIHSNAEAAKKSARRELVVVGIGSVLMIVLCLVGVPLIKKLRESDLYEHPEWLKRCWFEAAFGFLLLLLAFAVGRVRQIYGVICPHCRQLLFGISARLTTMTGNCPHCGERMLDEPK